MTEYFCPPNVCPFCPSNFCPLEIFFGNIYHCSYAALTPHRSCDPIVPLVETQQDIGVGGKNSSPKSGRIQDDVVVFGHCHGVGRELARLSRYGFIFCMKLDFSSHFGN